ncbi:hypothetical protein ABZX12_14335 [Kribbella sp. NPDC003505]|uniref:hypothetical protein n=1 Tax=Kribbella sp. NPDC003505 TaxID=3154448 RepID=UPI0033B0405A
MDDVAREWPDLNPGEVELDDTNEWLWRQVNPSWIDEGRCTTQAFQPLSSLTFKPTPKDEGQLSTARNAKATAEVAYEEFIAQGYQSAGSWAVVVSEVHSTGLRAVDDTESDTAPDPCPTGHTYIDFRILKSRGDIKRAASALRDAAEVRGRCHP